MFFKWKRVGFLAGLWLSWVLLEEQYLVTAISCLYVPVSTGPNSILATTPPDKHSLYQAHAWPFHRHPAQVLQPTMLPERTGTLDRVWKGWCRLTNSYVEEADQAHPV